MKEASQLSKFKGEENEDGTVNPTEFKMIFYVCLKMICERNNEIIKIDIQYYDIKWFACKSSRIALKTLGFWINKVFAFSVSCFANNCILCNNKWASCRDKGAL